MVIVAVYKSIRISECAAGRGHLHRLRPSGYKGAPEPLTRYNLVLSHNATAGRSRLWNLSLPESRANRSVSRQRDLFGIAVFQMPLLYHRQPFCVGAGIARRGPLPQSSPRATRHNRSQQPSPIHFSHRYFSHSLAITHFHNPFPQPLFPQSFPTTHSPQSFPALLPCTALPHKCLSGGHWRRVGLFEPP